jgi:hypothetical protein
MYWWKNSVAQVVSYTFTLNMEQRRVVVLYRNGGGFRSRIVLAADSAA